MDCGVIENVFDSFVMRCIDGESEFVAGNLGSGDEIFDYLAIPTVPTGIFLVARDF